MDEEKQFNEIAEVHVIVYDEGTKYEFLPLHCLNRSLYRWRRTDDGIIWLSRMYAVGEDVIGFFYSPIYPVFE